MKIFIINGSPRKNGGTASILRALVGMLPGHAEELSTYRSDIAPCVDCRCCWKEPGCAIEDGMQEVFRKIDEADCIVLASPIYFGELTGSLLNWASRLQYLFASRRFRGVRVLQQKKRHGVLILVDGGEGDSARAEQMGRTLLRLMGAPCEHLCYYSGTDYPGREDPMQDPAMIEKLREIAAAITDAKAAE